jgi:uncharacterized phiE125 gp8 family phage protein
MPLARLVAPAAAPVTLSEVKAHCRVDGTDDDALLAALLDVATAHFDGPAGLLGRALLAQTWRLTLPAFPAGPVRLPLPPLASLVAVRVLDGAGAYVAVPATDLVTVAGGDWGGDVRPASGLSWPATPDHPEAVEIEFVAGWSAPAAVPAPLRHAILLLAGHLYEHREPVVTGTIVADLPWSVGALVAPWRLPSVGLA